MLVVLVVANACGILFFGRFAGRLSLSLWFTQGKPLVGGLVVVASLRTEWVVGSTLTPAGLVRASNPKLPQAKSLYNSGS